MKAIFIVIALVCFVQSKSLNYTLSFNELAEGWVYLGKVELQPSVVKFVFNTKSSGRANSKIARLSLQAVASADWQTEQRAKCKNPINMPIVSFESPLNGRKSPDRTVTFAIDQKDTFHLIIKDCRGLAKSQYNNPDLKLAFTLRIFINDIQIPNTIDEQL